MQLFCHLSSQIELAAVLNERKVKVYRARWREESHELLWSGHCQHVVQGSCVLVGMEWKRMGKKGWQRGEREEKRRERDSEQLIACYQYTLLVLYNTCSYTHYLYKECGALPPSVGWLGCLLCHEWYRSLAVCLEGPSMGPAEEGGR